MGRNDQNVCKLILLGNGSVGKSSILKRFESDGFSRMYKQTVGLDFCEKRIILEGDKSVMVRVSDIGGQSVGSSMITSYIFGADVLFLVYDVTDAASFTGLDDWLGFVRDVKAGEVKGGAGAAAWAAAGASVRPAAGAPTTLQTKRLTKFTRNLFIISGLSVVHLDSHQLHMRDQSTGVRGLRVSKECVQRRLCPTNTGGPGTTRLRCREQDRHEPSAQGERKRARRLHRQGAPRWRLLHLSPEWGASPANVGLQD